MSQHDKPAGASAAGPGGKPVTTGALNELVRVDAVQGTPDRHIPEDVASRHTRDGVVYRPKDRPDQIALVDRGHRLHTLQPQSADAVRTLADVAQARGWRRLDVTGNDQFRQSAYIEVASRGIEVGGYEPTAKDREAVSHARELQQARANPLVRAYLEVDTVSSRDDAVRRHPQLREAFNETRKVEAAVEKMGASKAAATVLERYRENVAVALHSGRDIPKVTGVQATTSRSATPPDRDQGR